ncbi:hypothetical protein ACJX0J_027111, partial [Zea mays]
LNHHVAYDIIYKNLYDIIYISLGALLLDLILQINLPICDRTYMEYLDYSIDLIPIGKWTGIFLAYLIGTNMNIQRAYLSHVNFFEVAVNSRGTLGIGQPQETGICLVLETRILLHRGI